MPADQLIPTVNSRLSYVRWIASLLEMGRPGGHPPDVRGIDMYGNGPQQLPTSLPSPAPQWSNHGGHCRGTGATAVYALLAARIYGWHMLATDIVTGVFGPPGGEACSARDFVKWLPFLYLQRRLSMHARTWRPTGWRGG
jgi:hypothetical protein